MDEKLREQIALFRYGLIADLVHLEPGTGGIYRRLADKARHCYQIPGSSRTRVAVNTMRDWLTSYRAGGFDALKPRARTDSGRTRSLPPEVVDLLVTLKEDQPAWTVRSVIDQARKSPLVADSLALPQSTVHRLLAARGLMQRAAADPGAHKDRRRFAFANAGELWMSDVMHGPSVPADRRRKRKTYLIAFLDDATRVVPHAAFAFAENISTFLGVFRTALERRGIPDRLYVDNGAAYRSHRLALVCAQLAITLIHTRPRDPAAKGKQERFFRTLRIQLLPHLLDSDLQSLDALNRRLWAYIEGEYHQAPHRGLDGETPLERWARSASRVRLLDRQLNLDDLLLDEARRRVHKDRTVSLAGRVLEVDAVLVGASVRLRFDPEHPERPVQVFKDGLRFADARPVDAYANCFVRRHRPSDTFEICEPHKTSASRLRLADLRRCHNDDKEQR
ncbi:MAG: DDE-type integrase/transposase/recombinase [Acidimicrobiia bacterium]